MHKAETHLHQPPTGISAKRIGALLVKRCRSPTRSRGAGRRRSRMHAIS
jgi:hypothetical protein